MTRNIKWTIALVITISMFTVVSALANTIYMPIMLTSDPTPTPTRTPKPDISIEEIVYDPDDDPMDEYVLLKNNTDDSIDMEGWWFSSDKNNGRIDYDFPKFSFGADKEVKFWTKSGSDTSSNKYMGFDTPLWSDKADCVYLKYMDDDKRKTMDSYCYP